uniref:Agenet-like domain-containing protein n=1 Tax=Timema monikensis TaxID=170555 RepID=A0A7R9HKC1_9NEOP|nr:unnamed protein product [Timema monikensis]
MEDLAVEVCGENGAYYKVHQAPLFQQNLWHTDILPSGDSAGYLKSFSVSSEIVKPQKDAVAKSEISVEHIKSVTDN